MKAQEGTVWLARIHSQVLQQSLIDLSLNIRAFFRELKKKKNKIGGKWYMCMTCIVERELPKLEIPEDKVLGIDVGIRNYISTSDGRKIDNPRCLYHLLGKLRFLS